jgi:hypothetical protein
MAKFRNFSVAQQPVIDAVYRRCRIALEKAVADFGTDGFRRSFQQVFGGGSVATIKQGEAILEQTIKNMFMRLQTLSFSVEYAALGGGENANMLSFAGAAPNDVTNLVDSYRSANGNAEAMPMKLGPNFFAMDRISLTEQSQIETFLHELSHHAAGTIDDKVGGECYTMTGVMRLKGLGPLRATRNAENVGFFLTRYAF